MSRARRFATTILPAALVGGFLFASTFGHASGDDDLDEDAGAEVDLDADARRAPGRRTADAPPRRPVPPLPPAPPAPPGGWSQPPPTPPSGGPGGRFSISIRNGKVHVQGLEAFARQYLERVREMIRNDPSIPPDVRDKVLARLDRARAIVERRVRNLNTADLDRLGDEMEKMGDELEKAMEGLEGELEKLGEKIGKDLAQRLGKDLAQGLRPGVRFDHDGDRDRDRDRDDDDGDDDDDDGDDRAVVVGPDVDIDADTRGAIQDLPELTLRGEQRRRIAQLRTSYEKDIAAARKQLDDASRRLEEALADSRTSDADIARYVDQVSAHEAAIRKARLLTWVNARRVLDEEQRKQVEDAARKRHP